MVKSGCRRPECFHAGIWQKTDCWWQEWTFVCLLVGCLTSQQHASVSQLRICSDNCTCCHTEIEAADQTFHLLVCKSSKFEHVSPLLHSLHWLPISDRIDYKISSLTHSAICGTGPEYLSELVQIYTPSHPLRSSSDTSLLCIPSVRTKTYGQRSSSYQAPTTWNNLPAPLRHTESVTSFKTSLKTHLFSH